MNFIYAIFALFTQVVVLSTSATPVSNGNVMKRDVPENLIPAFGVTPGQHPDGTGNCQGVNPTPPIPCDCPPNRQDFVSVILHRCLYSTWYLTTRRA